jgi:hypothetical protein
MRGREYAPREPLTSAGGLRQRLLRVPMPMPRRKKVERKALAEGNRGGHEKGRASDGLAQIRTNSVFCGVRGARFCARSRMVTMRMGIALQPHGGGLHAQGAVARARTSAWISGRCSPGDTASATNVNGETVLAGGLDGD